MIRPHVEGRIRLDKVIRQGISALLNSATDWERDIRWYRWNVLLSERAILDLRSTCTVLHGSDIGRNLRSKQEPLEVSRTLLTTISTASLVLVLPKSSAVPFPRVTLWYMCFKQTVGGTSVLTQLIMAYIYL
jgi:hypothetical protein